MKFSFRNLLKLIIAIVLLMGLACSSSKFASNMPMEDRFKAAMELLEKGDFLRAKNQFTILVLNYPGTHIADKAQFYLAESYFGLKEYILAAAEYQKLVRNYPQSEFVDDSQYKVGLSYYELSPGYALDQNYTQIAVVEFQRFLEEFPTSDLRPKVEEMMSTARYKLAKKEFKSASLYNKSGNYRAAFIYYDEFLKTYYDTDFAEEALFRKGECQFKIEKWEDAIATFEEFAKKYPESRFIQMSYENLDVLRNKIATNGK